MARYDETLQDCRDHKGDCLSNKNGRCLALRDTKFSRPCPFYTTVEMAKKKLPPELAREVLERYGKTDY